MNRLTRQQIDAMLLRSLQYSWPGQCILVDNTDRTKEVIENWLAAPSMTVDLTFSPTDSEIEEALADLLPISGLEVPVEECEEDCSAEKFSESRFLDELESRSTREDNYDA